MNFSKRSLEKELLDGNDISFEEIGLNMQELDFINTWLGGHAISLSGLKQLLRGKEKVSIAEIGCGGGDNLQVLYRYCQRRKIRVRLTGIDMNPHCVSIARSKFSSAEAVFILSDYRDVVFGNEKPDVIFSSLFCHHFTDEELVGMLKWMKANARTGFFINDLHRHPLAYHAIRLLTRCFSRSRLVRHDAPLSVLRGFTRREWKRLLKSSGIQTTIRWKWAFRWLLVSHPS